MDEAAAADGPSDWQCVGEVQNGNVNAFELLVRRHQKRIYNLVFRMLGGKSEEATEAAHEVFILAFKAIRQFRGKSSFYTWIYRIAVNHAKTRREQLAKEKRLFNEPSPVDDFVADGLDIPFKQGEILAKNEFWTFNPEEMLEKKRFWNCAQAALNRLSAEHCEIFVLIKLEGRSYEDAAAILEIPINTVKSRLNRAREALANECAPLFKGQS